MLEATCLEPRPRPAREQHLGSLKFLSVSRTHVGCVRALNEDAVLNRPDLGLWAVADGMGGHDSGEVASAMIVDALADVRSFGSAYAFRDGVTAALQEVNTALLARAAQRGAQMIGSTVAALLAYDGHYACVWAGDTRVYHQRGGEFRRISRDHSVVQELLDAGALTPEEARSHKRGNVITRAVGAAPTLSLDVVYGHIRPGDRFLLCSDGLTTVVDDRDIEAMLIAPPLEAAVERLVNKALTRGAPDNVSVLLVGAERRAP